VSALWAAGAGAAIGLGVLVVVAAIRGRTGVVSEIFGRARARTVVVPVGVGLAAWLVTGWPVAAVAAGLAAVAGSRLFGGGEARESAIAQTEAIAAWTEMIRDAIGAASGLEEAVVATAPIAPGPLRPAVTMLVARLQRDSLAGSLVAFGEDVRHPSADLVVAALTIAARMEASDLTGLLTRLADAIRGDARMRIRVEVGRARIRTATRVIVGVVAATVVLLTVFNRRYLAAYDSFAGQVVLVVVAAIFAGGGLLIDRMAALSIPERFRARTGLA
jgi:tight adherence protein B